MSKKKCPICSTEMKIDTSAVCTSIPPKYRCVCLSCNCLDFIKTSEYDQYKEEPSLTSNVDEAAEISDLEAKNLADDYTKFLATGLTKNEPHPIGPQWMKKLALDRFKAGAEWMAGQGVTVDGVITKVGYKLDVETTEYILPEESEFERGDKVIVQIRKKQ